MGRILVVAPHADDEVAGCGGMIAKTDDEVHLVVFAVGNSIQAPIVTRMAEMERSCNVLGISESTMLYPRKSGYLDTIPMFEMVGRMDAVLETAQYDEVYIPSPCHMHDHTIVHDVMLAALRPGVHHPPRLVAIYDHIWPGWVAVPHYGKMYTDITETLEAKVAAMRCYESQLARHGPGHPISIETIEAIAAMRGLECGYRYAERYTIILERR